MRKESIAERESERKEAYSESGGILDTGRRRRKTWKRTINNKKPEESGREKSIEGELKKRVLISK